MAFVTKQSNPALLAHEIALHVRITVFVATIIMRTKKYSNYPGSFDGARLDSYVCSAALRAQNASCLAAIDAVGKLSISEFLPDSNSPVVSGVLTSYFKVAQSGRYDLRLQGTNVGGLVKVNGEVVIRATAPMEELTTTRAVYLEQGKNLRLHIEFSSSSPKTRTLALLIRAQGSEDFSLLNSTFVSINGTSWNFCSTTAVT
jgi:hypothetical protein